ncbi:hypothetical protein E2C01_098146 [Portunus trituberculatus]|uniref:Uncharacterized protein n=1 Tax=Portunus trituberculatus TaxID=210409 RepID=A0A5B7K7L9_PORTR|nr:hypothetical protein [Portunus trituberculatus]
MMVTRVARWYYSLTLRPGTIARWRVSVPDGYRVATRVVEPGRVGSLRRLATSFATSPPPLPRHRLMNPSRHRLMKPRYCPEVGFTRSQSTQAEVLSKLLDFWKSVEVKASTSEHNASWTTLGSTSPSTSPLRHLMSITSPRPVFFPLCLHIGLVLLLGIKGRLTL